MIAQLIVFAVILWLFLAAMAVIVKSEHDFERWGEAFDPSDDEVVMLDDATIEHDLRNVWGRLRISRVFRLPKRRRGRSRSRSLATQFQ